MNTTPANDDSEDNSGIDHLYKFLKNQIAFQESLQRALKPTLQFEQAIKQTAERFSSFQSSWATALAQQQDSLQTALLRAWQPTLQFEQTVRQIESSWATAITQHQANIQSALRHAMTVEDFTKFLSQIEEVAREVGEAQLNITPEGQIESTSGNLLLAEAAEEIGQLLDVEALTKREGELTKKVDAVLQEVHKQNSPLRLVILTILLPLLINILSDLINPAIRNMIESKDEHIHENETVRNLDAGHQTKVMDEMVSASILNVRERPNSKSGLLGKLYHGQIVTVLESDRGWKLVEAQHSNIPLRGWVFGRYLKTISK